MQQLRRQYSSRGGQTRDSSHRSSQQHRTQPTVVPASSTPPPTPPPHTLTLHSTGRFGRFGGKYVPETLIPALAELEVAYKEAMADPAFHVSCMLCGFDRMLLLHCMLLDCMVHAAIELTCTPIPHAPPG